MYVAKENELNDRGDIIAFMKRYNFAVIVTADGDVPAATHLPFHIQERGEQLFLTAHYAKANPQWKNIEEKKVLVIFSQPHAYISPAHYEKEQNVPTRNYIAVHAYGKCTIINDSAKGIEILEQMIMQSEPAFKQQWDNLAADYKMNLYKGIVPFEVEITELQATHKLSQNKTATEKQNIINALEKSEKSTERDIAEYMKKMRE